MAISSLKSVWLQFKIYFSELLLKNKALTVAKLKENNKLLIKGKKLF